ncbi:flavin-containing monooxygenase [Amycolatopsis saalfeldensis]|uniref:4-hydroxyacetophenone monooxygenase n=1 Tax=Amycolatopsis saalfeldensis TaxID=394193 RepID=A0A1H8XD07_9PSEU|nr:NAD(P)/FAD-dependent oxidoreductase [Amycolatopsis saalfeldensis]SEP37709.1 4-hydroxyacetophenone monooxygenase [Amycolatopsis saalfeldensis]
MPESVQLSAAELRERFQAAETPALLMLVAHLTDDPAVLRPQWRPDPDLLPATGLDAETDAAAREFCLAMLEPYLAGVDAWPAEPSAAVLEAIAAWALGRSAGEDADLLRVAFVPPGTDPRAPKWTKDDLDPARPMRVAIIGAGLSGLMAGLRMKQAGVDFTIFEKNADVGGTWYENSYPDCRIDVHSHIYTYSFFPHDWPSYFCRQDVIRSYLRGFAEENGLLAHIRFGTEVASAAWDDERLHWAVTTGGPDRPEEFSVLVSAVGQLNRPMIPRIDGLDAFAGPVFHTAQWDHDVDLAGKRVAMIGTGATGVQVAPAIARAAESLTVFQRSAPYLQPTPELREEIPEAGRALLRDIPLYRAYYRFSIFLPRAIGRLAAATVDPAYPPTERAVSAANEQLRRLLTDYLLEQVEDRPDLAAKIVPDYPPGAKRIIRDDGTWIATLKQDHVELVTERIARVDGSGIHTEDGHYVPVDVIVFGTGFHGSDFLMPMRVTGSGGADLHESWGVDACAYLGLTVPDFPNLFCMYGPNTNLLLHGNLVLFIECQSVYLLSAVEQLLSTGKSSLSLRRDVFDEYRDEVTEASALRVWGWSTTHSWYQNAEGRSTIMWPLSAHRYISATQAVDPEQYEFR